MYSALCATVPLMLQCTVPLLLQCPYCLCLPISYTASLFCTLYSVQFTIQCIVNSVTLYTVLYGVQCSVRILAWQVFARERWPAPASDIWLYTAHSTLPTLQECTVHTIHWNLYNSAHCTLHIVACTAVVYLADPLPNSSQGCLAPAHTKGLSF